MYQKSLRYDLQFLRYRVWQTESGNYQLFFSLLTLPTPSKPKKSEFGKNTKIAGDIIISHMCTKNHNHMRYSSWDTEWDRLNLLSFWSIICPFIPPPSLQPLKSTFWKNKRIIWRCLYFMSWSYNVCFLIYGVQQI